MALVIEATDESGPCGLPAISVCHYGEQNGDLMRDPEMCFELGFAAGAHLEPYYWRNDYAGIEQWSRFIRDGNYVFHTALFNEHQRFAKLWDNNLRQQGFAEAFESQQTTRPNPFPPRSGWESASAPQPQCNATAQGEQPCRILPPSNF